MAKAQIRVESGYDASTGLYYAEVFYPPDASTASVRTRARFATAEAAVDEAVKLMEAALSKSGSN